MGDIYLSYAWGGESEALADELQQVLADRGVSLRRDKHEMRAKDSIREFMTKIGQAGAVVLLISDKYLRSKYCMSELLQVFQAGSFKERIFFVVLSDAKIYDAIDLLDYVKYWRDKKAELEEKIRGVGYSNLHGIREDLDLYDDIGDMMPRIADRLRDMISLSPQQLRDSGYAELLAMAGASEPAPPAEEEPEPTSPYQTKLRPAPPGASIGHHQAGATTLGALVVDRREPDRHYILTDLTPFCMAGAAPNPGDGVIQPARPDGGTRADLIAKVSRFVLAHDRPADAASNLLALIARVRNRDTVCAEVPGVGLPRGVRPAVEGEAVSMVGRTSGRETGEVLQTDAQIEIRLPVGCVEGPMRSTGDGKTVPIIFAGLIETSRLVRPGDCGALLLGSEGYALGMAFAGSDETSFFFPLQRVLDALEVDLVVATADADEPSEPAAANRVISSQLRAELVSDHPERALAACEQLLANGLFDEAERFLGRVVNLSRKSRPDLEARAYLLLGRVRQQQAGIGPAKTYWRRSREIYRRLGSEAEKREVEKLLDEPN